MEQLKKTKKNVPMTNLINFTKRLFRLFRVRSRDEFKKLVRKDEPKLSEQQIDELIELNKDILVRIGDDADYDGMGNYGRFPPIKKDNE